MITIYGRATSSNVQLAMWAIGELGLAHERLDFGHRHGGTDTAEYRSMNPNGRVPVMKDGDLVMFESGAMVQHILDCHGGGRFQPPVGTPERAAYLQWSWFAESTFSRPLGEITNHRREFSEPIEACIEEMRNRARLCVAALEAYMAGKTYLVAEAFSGADIMMGYSLRGFQKHVPTDPLPPAVAAYFERISSRPAWQATLEAEQKALA